MLDEARCYGSVIETCNEDADGCLVWTPQTYCDESGQFCEEADGAASCVWECSDECSMEGETRCYGTLIETCTVGSEGCNDWVGGTDCMDTERLCDDSGESAACVEGCTDACLTVDETRCTGTMIQTCTVGEDGCNDWVDSADCNDTAQVCDDAGEAAACYTPCTGDCVVEDATRCTDSDALQICGHADDGCLYWTSVVDCSLAGYTCDVIDGDAYCVAPCESECDTVSGTQCAGDTVQTCTANVYDGCNYWRETADCTLTGQVCSTIGGSAACVDPAPILLLGDDVDVSGWDAYRNAMTAAGATFDVWDLDSLSFPTPTDLAAYDVLVWFDENTLIPGNTECQIVVDWLGLGGKSLFVSGVDFFWDLENGTSGMGEYNLYLMFETAYLGDYSGTGISALDGVVADAITGPFSITPLTLTGTSDSNGDYADSSAGAATKAAFYGAGGTGSGNAALSYYDSGTYKTVWLGVNFHNGLSDSTQQATLMDNVLAFFGF